MARAGFNITAAHPAINARCPGAQGTRRIIRSKELRDWVAAQGYAAHSTKPPIGTGAFFYCERNSDGKGHCGLIDANGGVRDTGAGDHFGDWRRYYW